MRPQWEDLAPLPEAILAYLCVWGLIIDTASATVAADIAIAWYTFLLPVFSKTVVDSKSKENNSHNS